VIFFQSDESKEMSKAQYMGLMQQLGAIAAGAKE
jgi:hypothetical protein